MFVVAPVIAVIIQFAASLYPGISLIVPGTFGLVVAVGTITTTRQQLAQFRVDRVYQESGIDRM